MSVATARPARNPLGIVALVLAILAAIIGVIASPVELVMQLDGGVPFQVVVLALSIPIGVLALVALILGIVATRRPRSKASPGAAIGIAAFLLIGQVLGLAVDAIAFAL
jgi:disulfide bond formation protein DsbB